MNYSRYFFQALMVAFVLLSVFCITTKVRADIPEAALLLDENANAYNASGIRVNITNLGSSMRGLTTDATTVYSMNSSGNIVSIPLSAIDMTPAQTQQNIMGTVHTVGWGSDGAPALPNNLGPLSIAYSAGCIFVTNSSNTVGEIELYCIDVTDFSVTEIEVPSDKPLPAGYYYSYSNLIDFPDGRIGKVSGFTNVGGVWQSTLRLYTVSGTGSSITLAWSEDILMNDSTNWATDEHGIGTDGTYLYRIQWRDYYPDTKVWQLSSGAPSEIVYQGEYTKPFGNMHYLSHNHVDNYYLVGNFDGTQFFITSSADPGPGPGNPLIPAYGPRTSTVDGYTVSVTNYDPAFEWEVSVSSGTAVMNSSGVVTVTGLLPGASATITVFAKKVGIPDGSSDAAGSAIPDDNDGVDASEENGAPNDGDGNGDGILDSQQQTVASLRNAQVSLTAYLTLEIDGSTCSALTGVSVGAAPSDSGYAYPAGLLDFEANCTTGATTTVTIYYDQEYDTSNWVARKYQNGAYGTIDTAQFGTANIGGTVVTTLSYELADGGELDADGLVNGIIKDPVGPAFAVVSNNPTPGSTVRKTSGYRPNPSADVSGSVCKPYLTKYIRYGSDNDADEVRKLETFLNEKQGESLAIDGVYGSDDVEAVKRFQAKHKSEVLGVWGLSEPTGYVYRTTLMKINSFYCNSSLSCPAFVEHNSLLQNSASNEVLKTKTLLSELGFYSDAVDSVFDASLHASLRDFQETFSETMLKPWGLAHGTGYKYKTTNKFLNMLVGCATGPVDLDGEGTFDY